mmetsp:Transcript_23048/g.46622  ORF Transcript_23048/g.46622 Transcript_23048/m.46622 type:complete len:252 (+) Transcript_23048:702-1457(+)
MIIAVCNDYVSLHVHCDPPRRVKFPDIDTFTTKFPHQFPICTPEYLDLVTSSVQNNDVPTRINRCVALSSKLAFANKKTFPRRNGPNNASVDSCGIQDHSQDILERKPWVGVNPPLPTSCTAEPGMIGHQEGQLVLIRQMFYHPWRQCCAREEQQKSNSPKDEVHEDGNTLVDGCHQRGWRRTVLVSAGLRHVVAVLIGFRLGLSPRDGLLRHVGLRARFVLAMSPLRRTDCSLSARLRKRVQKEVNQHCV